MDETTYIGLRDGDCEDLCVAFEEKRRHLPDALHGMSFEALGTLSEAEQQRLANEYGSSILTWIRLIMLLWELFSKRQSRRRCMSEVSTPSPPGELP